MPVRSILAVFLACFFLLDARPTAAEPSRPLAAVFVNPGKNGEVFWDMVTATMAAAGRQLGIAVETVYAERNYRMMQELGIAVTKRADKPDFLLLVNEDAAAIPIMEAAEAAGIKTFLVSNTFVGADAERFGPPRIVLKNWIGSIVPDMEMAGARMAAAIFNAARASGQQSADGRIHILAIGGHEKTPTSIERNNGLQRAAVDAEDVVIDRLLFANWNAAEAESITANYLAWAMRKGIRVAGVWAGNDPMALGAMKAVSDAGLQPGKDVYVAGLNWSKDALTEVEAGRMLLTDGGHFMMGGWSIVLLRDFADGCDFVREGADVRFRTSAVTRVEAPLMRQMVANGAFQRIDFSRFLAAKGGVCGQYDFSVEALLRAFQPAGGY